MIYTESPHRQQITKQVSWGHWFALANILMAVVISSVYLFSGPSAETPISVIYMVTTWLGHTSFLTFLGFIILILPLCYKITHLNTLKATASVIAALCLALLAFDALLYNKTGFHLSFSSAELLKSETRGQVNAFGWLQWFYLVLLFVIWLMFQLVVANAIFKRIARLQKFKVSPYIMVSLVLCFVVSHAIHVWADAKLYTPVLKQDNMFPLSYPATAKTLMARYGLLDLEVRQQREELQYNSENNRFNYPPRPVYCSVDNKVKVVVLSSLEPVARTSYNGLKANQFHLNLQQKPSKLLDQLLYGIPNNLLSLTKSPPVVVELLEAFDVTTTTFIETNTSEDTAEFLNAIQSSENGLFIGILSADTLAALDQTLLDENTELMIIQQNESENFYKLYSRFVDFNQISSNEDITPTILSKFGCLADVNRYSTGQSLLSPSKNWLVSTEKNNLIIVKYPLLTSVGKDGSFEVLDLNDNTKKLLEIDTNLLSRSIKHLKDFSDR
ncbi:DUF3413 domain-containing protein [Glaciecola sp. 2405UD65-10]|uniref:DUF3413 domain-containing protein n=1 Tax=Glaciecola sp. 2405UD65-10 TaxID=3397244 RepID=UPI003B5C1769